MDQRLSEALERIADRRDEMAETVAALVRFESVRPPRGAADPIGPDIRECLAYAIDLCRQRGMATRIHEDQVGVAELGEGEQNVAVVVHLDVVPAGDGWTHPPFAGVIADGQVWGRGTEDDKGPLASVLAAVDALVEAEVPLARRITLVLGTDEETGFWRDLEAFHRHEPMPTMALVPDGSFPIVTAEKGFANIELLFAPRSTGGFLRGASSRAPRIVSLTAGDRPNIVPALAEAVVEGLEPTYLASRARAYTLGRPGARFEVSEGEGGRVRVTAHGVPAHGSTPEKGRNALLDLVALLAPEVWAPSAAESAVRFVDLAVGHDLNGERLGLFAEDPFMGFCTLNVGTAETLADGGCRVWCNLRTVVGQSAPEVAGAFEAMAQAFARDLGMKVAVRLEETAREPFRIAEDSELVRGLTSAYAEIMGEAPGCVSMGGTTFAKGFANAVAFGPKLADEEDHAHQRDERVPIDDLVRTARIYAAALAALAGAPGR
jgi:succinyl-diaminopimelate desuccinylase